MWVVGGTSAARASARSAASSACSRPASVSQGPQLDKPRPPRGAPRCPACPASVARFPRATSTEAPNRTVNERNSGALGFWDTRLCGRFTLRAIPVVSSGYSRSPPARASAELSSNSPGRLPALHLRPQGGQARAELDRLAGALPVLLHLQLELRELPPVLRLRRRRGPAAKLSESRGVKRRLLKRSCRSRAFL